MIKTGSKQIRILFVMLTLSVFIMGWTSENMEECAIIKCMKSAITIANEISLEQQVEYEPCTLRFSWWGDEEGNRSMRQAIDAFEDKYPGIQIETEESFEDGREEILIEQLCAQTAPDINRISWEWLNQYSEDGSLFYDIYKEYETLNLGSFGQEYLNLCTVAEELQALPTAVTGQVFLFNENLFVRAGADIPQTWKELLKVGEVFLNQMGEEYYPLALNKTDRMELAIYYLESVYGREWIVNGVPQYGVEEIEEAMEFLLELEEMHVIPTIQRMLSKENSDRDSGWSSGCYGGVFVWDEKTKEYGNMLPSDNHLTVGNGFKNGERVQAGYYKVSTAYAISENCANPREAALLLDFLFNQEEGVLNLSDTFSVPLSRVAREYGEVQGVFDETELMANQVGVGESFPANEYVVAYIENESAYEEVISGLSYGDYNAREAAQLIVDSFDK